MHFVTQGSNSISVLQNNHYRWLKINDIVQTVMNLREPQQLILPHLHAMLLSLYHQPKPKRLMELGLGGGALQRFFGHFFDDINLLSIELNQQVIESFSQFFSSNNHHKIKHQDAREALKNTQNLDLLFVDLFSGNASPNFINELDFYQDCFATLNKNGMLVMNLLPIAEIQTQHVMDLLSEISGHPTQLFSIPQYRNRIFFTSKQALPKIDFDNRLTSMAQKYGIDLTNVVQLN